MSIHLQDVRSYVRNSVKSAFRILTPVGCTANDLQRHSIQENKCGVTHGLCGLLMNPIQHERVKRHLIWCIRILNEIDYTTD